MVPVLPYLVFGDRLIEYTIKYSRLASYIKIMVDAKDGVQVTAPLACDTKTISSIVQDKGTWILEKMDYLADLAGCPVPRLFVDGEQFFYLGNRFEFKVQASEQVRRREVIINGRQMLVKVPRAVHLEGGAEAVRAALVKWYRKQANLIINERINLYTDMMSVEPAKIRIKEQKHRWGSCSGKGNLNFNWHLVMAPEHIIDYVVVHELCHLKRLDHSPVFWGLVEAILPDYQNRRSWLKQYGPVLTF